MKFWKCFVFKVSVFFLIKIEEFSREFWKKNISHNNMFFKRAFRIFQKSLVKSLTLPLKHYKKFHNCWSNLDRLNRKQNSKNAKKIKKK